MLVIQVFLIFVVVPLSGMDAIPPSVVPMAFALLVLAILVVTSRSYVVSALVLIRPPSETTMPGPPRF